MNKPASFEEFPPLSARAWKQNIQAELGGEDYNHSLIWRSPEGISVKPFYTAEDLDKHPVSPTGSPADWFLGQEVYVGDALSANHQARAALENGADRIFFQIPAPGIPARKLLESLSFAQGQLHFCPDFLSGDFTEEFLGAVADSSQNTFLHTDVIGKLASSGNWYQSREADFSRLDKIAAACEKYPGLHLLGVNAALYQNAGADRVQQLAYALAHATEYLHHFRDKAPPPLFFRMAIGSEYFHEIAKLRALRLLWHSLAAAYGAQAECHILAVPSKRNKTVYNYNTNMIRTTAETMAGILGGADTLLNLPYDALYKPDNEFGNRIARNQLLILKHESRFGQVSNAADGAYYVEELSRQLAEKALELFKGIERGGGFLKQLMDHKIQRKIRESAAAEESLFEAGSLVLVGGNRYNKTAEPMKVQGELYPFQKKRAGKTLIEPILEKRLASRLEQKKWENE